MFDWYAPSPNPDELYHWKYKRKYKGPSGEWVYVYDDGSMSEAGQTKSTYSETDSQGNTTIYENRVVTDPKRWTSRKSTSERVTTDTITENGQSRTTTTHTITQTVERGKMHMAKMDMQRKITDLPHTLNEMRKKSDAANRRVVKENKKKKVNPNGWIWEK